MPRVAAALIALVCWAGIALQFSATYANQHDVLLTLWVLGRFFTIITNLAVGIAMTRIGLGGRVSPFVLGGLTLAILLVGIVYLTLLRGLHPLDGPALARSPAKAFTACCNNGVAASRPSVSRSA